MVESSKSERLKDGTIVFALNPVGSHLRRFKPPARARFMIKDGGVKLFLCGEVTKDHGLRDTRGLGDLLGGRSPETSFREEAYSNAQNLKPALLAGHSGATRRPIDCHLLTQDCSVFPSLAQSKYLLTTPKRRCQAPSLTTLSNH